MSAQDAEAFLDRLEDDEAFAREIAGLREDPPALRARVAAEGFDVTAEEAVEAFLERYGSELTEEQLEAIAAGGSLEMGIGVGIGAGIGVALFIGAIAGL